VFDSVREIAPRGAGLNVQPHAVKVLAQLGLLEALDAVSMRPREMILMNRFGQTVWREPRGLAAGYDTPQLSTHRGLFQQVLAQAVRARLGEAAILTDRRLLSFTQDAQGVEVQCAARDGTQHRITGAALIGADGIHSPVRRQFYPSEGAPLWNGLVGWRGNVRAKPFLGGESWFIAGHFDCKFVCYPYGRVGQDGLQDITWTAEVRMGEHGTWRKEDWNREAHLSDFLPHFADWDFGWVNVPDLIRAAPTLLEFPMVDRDPLPRWSHGRITLLGDAAHPMVPIGANGGSQAILDADALARACAAQPELPRAFTSYEAERLPVANAVVLQNRKLGPEKVLALVHERAPRGFANINDVVSHDELNAIAQSYKQTAGFAVSQVNARAA
jgi:5-methylphenazine-1-carboxylate 1-monooxygenase